MTVGSKEDFVTRIKALLPNGWFSGTTPILDAILNGIGHALAAMYDLIVYAGLQTRVQTATDAFLDLISNDFFGSGLKRRLQEADSSFRTRILSALLREKATRKGMRDALVALTGREPIIIEPANPIDTGAYGSLYGYGFGAYGSIVHPYHAFITAYRAATAGIPNVAGYGNSPAGYGVGQAEYASLDMIQGEVTDADIYAAMEATKVAGSQIWARIVN